MSKKIFITGTNTDVGKTFVTGLLLKKLHEHNKNAAYYKAAMSDNEYDLKGNLIPGDALYVKKTSFIEQPLKEMCPYIYKAAVSPHLAAKLEGNPIELSTVLKGLDYVDSKYDFVFVEGSGGIICPLRYDEQKIGLDDFVKQANLDCLIVADAGLGTINSVVLTTSYMKSKKINIKGIIFNNYEEGNVMHEDNLYMCEQLTGLKVIECVKKDATDLDIDCNTLIQTIF